MPTKEEVWKGLSRIVAEELYKILSMDPREAAEAAYLRGGPSVDELEVRIRNRQKAAGVRPPRTSKKPGAGTTGLNK